MNRFVRNQKGLTLIELLMAITISSIIIVTIYSVFLTGIKAYQKIGIEGFLRDEADYVLSMIVNEMNKSSVDFISYCETDSGIREVNCIELIDSKLINVAEDAKEIVEEQDKEIKKIRFYFGDSIDMGITLNNGPEVRSTISSNLAIFTNSTIELKGISEVYNQDNAQLKMYTSAMIEMSLQVAHSRYTKDSSLYIEPLQLQSKFGF